MSIVTIILNIFALIGVVVILLVAIYYTVQYMKHRTSIRIASQMNPPGAYMQNSGIKCPDYWVNTGIDSNGNYICKNSFNIESVNPTTGSTAGLCNPTQLTFNPIQSGYTWELNNPNGLTSYTDDEKYTFLNATPVNGSTLNRCQWINSCGPSSNVQGIWSGVNEICNNPKSTPM